MQFKVAELSDIDDVLELHYRYQVDSIDEEDKKDGFVTTAFTKEQLSKLINDENGLFIARDGKRVVAYVMAILVDLADVRSHGERTARPGVLGRETECR